MSSMSICCLFLRSKNLSATSWHAPATLSLCMNRTPCDHPYPCKLVITDLICSPLECIPENWKLIPLHGSVSYWISVSLVACIISATSRDKPGDLCFFIFFSAVITPGIQSAVPSYTMGALWSHWFSSFIKYSTYFYHMSLIPFSLTTAQQLERHILPFLYHLSGYSKNLIFILRIVQITCNFRPVIFVN